MYGFRAAGKIIFLAIYLWKGYVSSLEGSYYPPKTNMEPQRWGFGTLVVQKDVFPATFHFLLGGSAHLVSSDRIIPIYKPWISGHMEG